MNQRGDVFMGIIYLVIALVIAGLYIANLEDPIQDSIIDLPENGQSSDFYLIIFSAGILLVLYGVYRFSQSSDSLSFGGG